jgi:hypothetical protein
MFGLTKKKGPTRPFMHASDCKILAADPGVEIPWQEVETGHWVAECQCGKEHERVAADRRVRHNPYTHPPSATRPSASTGTRPIPRSSGPS